MTVVARCRPGAALLTLGLVLTSACSSVSPRGENVFFVVVPSGATAAILTCTGFPVLRDPDIGACQNRLVDLR